MLNNKKLLFSFFTILISLLTSLTLITHADAQTQTSGPSCNPYLSTVSTIVLGERNKLPLKTLQVSLFPQRNKALGLWGSAKAELNYVVGKKDYPLVVLMVGLGSPSTVGYARFLMEQLYQQGFSVVSVPSSFHMSSSVAFSEFMRPGLSSQDATDLLKIVNIATRKIIDLHRLTSSEQHLIGVSLGGYHAASILADPATADRFEKYVLINPPLDLSYGMAVLDNLAEGKGNLTEQQKSNIADQMNPYLTDSPQSPNAKEVMKVIEKNHFGEKELGFFVGLKMRSSVRDIVFASQQIHDDQLLKNSRLAKRFAESHTWKINDYFARVAWPFYKALEESDQNMPAVDSQLSIWDNLKKAPRPRDVLILHAKDDFISRPVSLEMLKFLPMNVVLANCGGHVGALSYPVYMTPLKEFLSED